jgi:ribose transport system substrate-binding protein
VDLLLEEKVRLVVVDQPDEEVALSISEKCQKAGVPLLAINYPHPGAYYFGGNNYLAGQLAGKFLRKHVMSHWHGHVDSMFLLPVKGHSFSQEAHKEGIREVFCKEERLLPQEEIFEAPPGFSEQDGYRETKAFLREAGRKPRHLIIAAMSDFLGMGAAKAVHQMGLSESAVIVGAGAARDTRSLIMRGGPFRASVAYFPESYGDRIVNLSLKILGKEEAPLTSFTNHALLAHENLREYYP